MSSAMDQLYQQIILDHAKNPLGRGETRDLPVEVHHVNPTCGDEITLAVELDFATEDPVIESVRWNGQGCSISQASASVMADLVTGLKVSEAMDLSEKFLTLMNSRGHVEPDEDELGDAVAFVGVAKYPARIKCALLGWMALKDAITQTLALNEGDKT